VLNSRNHLDQPIGFLVKDWQPPPLPSKDVLEGRFCHLEPLEIKHAESLYASFSLDTEGRNWTYLPYGPFDSLASISSWIEKDCLGNDPLFFAIVERTSGKAIGVASYLRITPNSGSIEVGHINYSPLLQRTPAATEAMYLMMSKAFELGYRRYEWKCDTLNAPSRATAQRLGFSFEGIFRQATVVKGRNRDTAWYAITDADWIELKKAYLQWLSPANFNELGAQKLRLSNLTHRAVKP
jgi:RimJ/RimL family protein N-acetyltransferase